MLDMKSSNTWEQEDGKFKAILDYVATPCPPKNKKAKPKTKITMYFIKAASRQCSPPKPHLDEFCCTYMICVLEDTLSAYE
jgi:hypothetical protein